MSDIYLLRTGTGLVAHGETARDTLRRFRIGDVIQAKLRRPRNLAHHRRFFAMLNVVYSACGNWSDPEALLDDLKFHVGLVDRRQVIDFKTGEVLAEIVKPKSISFAAMDQAQFEQFYEKCVSAICEKMVPGLEDHVLREEVLRAVA